MCTYCRHWLAFRQCAAFPAEIPMVIWAGLETHERPYPGDHGIRFEAVPGAKITRPQPPDPTIIQILCEDGLLPIEEPAEEPAPQPV
jgi:hypothetical protein